MRYQAIGLMSGSSMDGVDITFATYTETGGKWQYELLIAETFPYSAQWEQDLANAVDLNARNYQLLHTRYGRFLGDLINQFIAKYQLAHQVHVIASHGHTTFHEPNLYTTCQLGDGASIAAITQLPVVSDLRAMDVAVKGQGAPIVPMGERLLFAQYPMLLNLGGIANISIHQNENVLAFDIAAANQVFNHFANLMGFPFDDGGKLAASGQVHEPLLQALDRLEFYSKAAPKSLANSFSKQTVIPLMETFQLSAVDQLATYIEHLSKIISSTVQTYADADLTQQPLLVTGGGALNTFLINKLKQTLETSAIQLVVPDDNTVLFKEALIMGLLGILRWREEVTALKTVTGAERNTIGGALWLGA
ncbi:MAG: hypothetical protein RLY16_2120 [Bacteroidota bacterium]|jgi:anhydro-N-acetylmuramic acid kinase